MSSNRTTIVRTSRPYQRLLADPGPDRFLAERNPPGTQDRRRRSETGHRVGLASRLILNSVSIFVLSGVFGLAVLATAPLLMGFKTVVIGSGSMEPSLRSADVVVMADPDELAIGPGSVINYRADQYGPRMHRVVEVLPDGYRTKGDANPIADSQIVDPETVNGIGIYVVPFIGRPHQWLTDGHWFKIIASGAALLLLASTERAGFVDRPQPRTNGQLGPMVVHRRQRRLSS